MSKQLKKDSWEWIEFMFNNISEYSSIIAQLKAGKSFNGLRVHQLPTFKYYIENCIENKEGPYDFTRRYSIHSSLKCSFYMGTGFNYSNHE